MVAQLGQRESVTYVATKGAIDAMTRAVAVDEAKYDVRANAIAPSCIFTPLWEELIEQQGNGSQMKEV